ncbi:DinB family protein [Paenibacillus thermotolerans]|uniref:DinB family protein n=1 Tax=Paenibacillus thermotolerans TaxID=3027807 RepID=UPI002368A3FE|nr:MULTISPECIES: DinB family protein [unclassified Paenibacillus]
MKAMFRYNWAVREDWYRWCEDVPEKELLRVRTGGIGGILHTLFHIADVEWSWIRLMQGKPDFQESFDDYNSLEKVRALDAAFRTEVVEFVEAWEEGMEQRPLYVPQPDGSVRVYAWGEVMCHAIAHEIHHIGQLSVWAREVGKKPVSANAIGRGLVVPMR